SVAQNDRTGDTTVSAQRHFYGAPAVIYLSVQQTGQKSQGTRQTPLLSVASLGPTRTQRLCRVQARGADGPHADLRGHGREPLRQLCLFDRCAYRRQRSHEPSGFLGRSSGGRSTPLPTVSPLSRALQQCPSVLLWQLRSPGVPADARLGGTRQEQCRAVDECHQRLVTALCQYLLPDLFQRTQSDRALSWVRMVRA